MNLAGPASGFGQVRVEHANFGPEVFTFLNEFDMAGMHQVLFLGIFARKNNVEGYIEIYDAHWFISIISPHAHRKRFSPFEIAEIFVADIEHLLEVFRCSLLQGEEHHVGQRLLSWTLGPGKPDGSQGKHHQRG